MFRVLQFVLVIFLVSSCANKSLVNIDEEALSKVDVKKVYVSRFEGNPDFVEESTDFFVAKLESELDDADVVQGEVIREESYDINKGSNLAKRSDLISFAKKYNTDLAIQNKITSYNNGVTMNAFATSRIIDLNTGEVIASFHRPSGLLMAYSEHQCAIAAVERVAEDVAKALRNR
jgi:hypothetical protein